MTRRLRFFSVFACLAFLSLGWFLLDHLRDAITVNSLLLSELPMESGICPDPPARTPAGTRLLEFHCARLSENLEGFAEIMGALDEGASPATLSAAAGLHSGLAHLKLGQVEEAALSLRTTPLGDPDLAPGNQAFHLILERGWKEVLRQRAGAPGDRDWSSAEDHYHLLTLLYPRNRRVWSYLLEFYQHYEKNPEKWEKTLHEILERFPRWAYPRLEKARRLLADESPEEALQWIERAFHSEPGEEEVYLLAQRALLRSRDPQMVELWRERAVSFLSPGSESRRGLLDAGLDPNERDRQDGSS